MKIANLTAGFLITCLSFCGSLSADVVLTFDQAGFSDGQLVDQAYGDRVVASPDLNGHVYDIIPGAGLGLTPNVEVFYDTMGDNLQMWGSGYADLNNVLYKAGSNNTDHLLITFTADPGFEVGLFGFDLGAFGSAVVVDAMEIRDVGGSVLWSQGSTLIPGSGSGHLSIDFADGIFASQLTLDLNYSSAGALMGIDNIHFAQRTAATVPEPAGMAYGTGLLLLMTRRRRSQSA